MDVPLVVSGKFRYKFFPDTIYNLQFIYNKLIMRILIRQKTMIVQFELNVTILL